MAASAILSNNCNPDLKNPNAKEDITHLPPQTLVQDILAKERRIGDIMSEIVALLEKRAVEEEG